MDREHGWDEEREVVLDDELLPDVTADELDTSWGDRPSRRDDIAWYLSERPPHHEDGYDS